MHSHSPALTPAHVAAFYHADDFIVSRVADFIADGLARRERVLSMCTGEHWTAIAAHLDAAGVAHGRAAGAGRLIVLDASEIVETVTVDGKVSAAVFFEMLAPILDAAGPIRIYGEVVSLLAARGEVDAAIGIEQFAQTLSQERGVPVLCGYHLGGAQPLTPGDIARVNAVHDGSITEDVPEQSVQDRGHFHAVRFYQDQTSLAKIAARFIAEGLQSGLPGVIIATPAHRDAIRDVLRDQAFDVPQLERESNLIFADARELLAQFMVDGLPHASRFRAAVIPLIEAARRGRTDCVVRAYGEMVDVLWKDGQTSAAIRLETLWNQLAQTQAFALLCGYSMGHFYKDGARRQIEDLHTHIAREAAGSIVFKPS